jgi:hypothetical protein
MVMRKLEAHIPRPTIPLYVLPVVADMHPRSCTPVAPTHARSGANAQRPESDAMCPLFGRYKLTISDSYASSCHP